jgi:hypothetical protein
MPDWDANSPELRDNLARVRASIQQDADDRVVPTLAVARAWHTRMMAGLTLPDDVVAGRFRGERGLEDYEVEIGDAPGVWASRVATALRECESTLQQLVSALDTRFPPGAALDEDGLAAVIDVAAWAHAEWVRIHPFPNGNGRTARAWVNWIFVRYGVPPIVPLRPRPDNGYAAACAEAMRGRWQPTAVVFRSMLREATASARRRSTGRER